MSSAAERKRQARAFADYWAAAEGYEIGEAQSFWRDFAHRLLGIADVNGYIDFERRVKGKRIDAFVEDYGVLIEHKSRGVDLDAPERRGGKMLTPYQQAKEYADNLPHSVHPRWIITCNFDEFRIHDLDLDNPGREYESIMLSELPELLHRFSFMNRKENSRLEREKDLSVAAGEIVGKLYGGLSGKYLDIENSEEEQRSLNILITRLVFLLYAEDAGLLQEHQAFYRYLERYEAAGVRDALVELFRVLDQPYAERDKYANPILLAFPYVNGGLFAGDIVIPQFDDGLRELLLTEASAGFDWKHISPTIFGAVFESTLNPETRRQGGMHYTSIENIHKVTGPLFHDALVEELARIEGIRVERERKFRLRAFHEKLASVKVLDPACGSGNFLTETYIGLRKLENRVLESLQDGRISMATEADSPIKVSIGQFYGIEINDFAVSVARTALWIAEQQMAEKTQEITMQWFDFLPLKSLPNVVCGNALRMDWDDVLPASECNYIIGNPPYKGAHASEQPRTPKQTADLVNAFGGKKGTADADYVAAWFAKAADYANGRTIPTAFVATNSIGQGQQPAIIMPYLWERGLKVIFAYQPFLWGSEANDKAAVAVTIVGMSSGNEQPIWFDTEYRTGDVIGKSEVNNIGPYLKPGPNDFVGNRSKPLCDVPEMKIGSQPIDGGNYIFKPVEREDFLRREPGAERFIHEFLGSAEFLNNRMRYVLWLGEASDDDLASLPLCRERIENVRLYRLASNRASTRKAAEAPNHFGTEIISKTNSIAVPEVSSERREYIPIGFMTPDIFCSNKLRLIPDADIYMFGVLHSQFHNAWMRSVAGRLEARYSYSTGVVYNNFVWPEPTVEQRQIVEECAQAVLDARDAHPGDSLATLYDPDRMPADLMAAHKALDAAVEATYGVDFGGDEEKIVAHLFKLYAEKTKKAKNK